MGKKERKPRPINELEFDESLLDNANSFMNYYQRLTDIGLNCFKWNNLPDTIDERFLELTLYEDGMAIFFKDEDLDGQPYLALQVRIGGLLNVYRIPMERTAYATNGYQMRLNEKNSVIIWNNRIHTPSKSDVALFSKRLYNIDRTIDVNVDGQKFPIVITCDEKQRLTMMNLYMKYKGNQPFIFGGKDLDLNAIKVLNTNSPYVADKLYLLKEKYWNEALTYLGIPNVGNDKKERMITSEVDSTMGGVFANRLSRLNARQQACEEINRMFGLDISVEYRDGVDTGMVAESEDNNE